MFYKIEINVGHGSEGHSLEITEYIKRFKMFFKEDLKEGNWMKLYYFEGLLTVAEDNKQAVENFKQENQHLYLENLSEYEVEELNEVKGYKIQLIKS